MIKPFYLHGMCLMALLGVTGAMAQSYRDPVPISWCDNVKQSKNLNDYTECRRLHLAVQQCVDQASSEKARDECLASAVKFWMWQAYRPGPTR